MRVFYQLEALPSFIKAVVTIGSFDGVHTGHRQLLSRIQHLAKQCGGESVVVTFDPHPRQVIYPQDDTLQLLTSTEEKIALFKELGIDNVVIVPFTVAFSQMSADEYIENFLLAKFHPHTIVIGYDHRFGLNRQGDIAYLKWYSERSNFTVIEIPPQEVDQIAVSSTKIRNALLERKLAEANKWLGYSFRLTGKVVKGQQIGTGLGYPTANIVPHQSVKLIPADGIYAVRVEYEGVSYDGMLYIGSRPTVNKGLARSIEVNIFDFAKDIYGDNITVELVAFLRDDAVFDNLDALKTQLQKDREAALSALRVSSKLACQKTDTAIVILNYNGAPFLREYLPSVLDSIADSDARVIVADNASTDDSLTVLANEFPSVKVLQNKHNLGFAAGYNEALRQIDASYYILLNSDVRVTRGWWEPCVALLQSDSTIAACQPKIRSIAQPTHFEYAGGAGGWIDTLGYPFCRGRIFAETELDQGQYDGTEEVFWASGAAICVRADLFHALGGFDGEYFAHAEEIELCWRFKRAGFKVMALSDATVYHLGGGTLDYLSPRKAYLNFHNTLVTGFKNEPISKLLWWLPLRLVLDGLAGILFLAQGKYAHISAIIRAHWHFFPKIRHWYKKRMAYQQLIEANRIGQANQKGRYNGSIVWDYYALGKTSFQSLRGKNKEKPFL
ncbi:MAG: bifunctional riboflavin kinase/FAD synthetase [Saprospiraceae bacterium]